MELTNQEIELLETLLKPVAEDDGNSNFTRKVAINILTKLSNEQDPRNSRIKGSR
jgi:uncharacterized protein (UPF0147 family)